MHHQRNSAAGRNYSGRRNIVGLTILDRDDGEHFAVADGEPPPCDSCEHKTRCAAEEIACAQFLRFTQFEDHEGFERIPCREIYDLVFAEEQPSSHNVLDALNGNYSRQEAVARELHIKEKLSMHLYDHSARALNRCNPDTPYGIAKRERIQSVRAVVTRALECEYSDAAIAVRTGASLDFVRRLRKQHSIASGATAKGSIQALSKWIKDESKDYGKNKRVTA